LVAALNRTLIYPTLLKTVVFSVFVAAFILIEHMINGLWEGTGAMGSLIDFFRKGPCELLAGCLIIFVSLIPFFAFRELGRVLGEGKLWARYFFGVHKLPVDRLGLGLDHEDAIEMYYTAAITPWLNVSPNLQVINFGMNKTLGNGNGLQAMNAAVEANLRMNIQF
jgi:hypothetical protein